MIGIIFLPSEDRKFTEINENGKRTATHRSKGQQVSYTVTCNYAAPTRMLTFTASDVNTGCKTVLLKMLLSGMRLAFSTA